jgi:hypothetical protein
MVSVHNLPVERMATARLRAACKVLEVDRGTCGKAGLVIALLTIAPAMAKPIAHHAVFFKALRKPPAAAVPWALRLDPSPCPRTRAPSGGARRTNPEGRKRRVRDTRH